MGFFSNMFGQAKELSKLGNAVANVKNMLDQYEQDPDNSFLIVAAWICKVGVNDLIIKNNWAPNYQVYVPINGHQTKMLMNEVRMHTVVRLINKASNVSDAVKDYILEIIDGGNAFYEIDRQIPYDIRKVIETPQ